MAQHTGKVVWFNNAKGFGFLSNGIEADVFCHYSAIESDGFKSLNEGDVVEYDVEIGREGRQQAARVKRL